MQKSREQKCSQRGKYAMALKQERPVLLGYSEQQREMWLERLAGVRLCRA